MTASRTRVAAALALVLRGSGLPAPDGHRRLVVDATALAARAAPDPGLVDFDMGPLPPGRGHPGAELVQDTEGSLVIPTADF